MIAYPDCLECRHCRLPESPTCDAFPNGIPREILIEGRGHRRPYPGDHGILFEPKPDQVENTQEPVLAKAS